MPHRQLSNDERVHQDLLSIEQVYQHLVSMAQMINPYRAVDQDHAIFERRLRTGFRPGAEPPSRASRRAASR